MTDDVVKPRPFLKWVGGKTQLLPELIARIPTTWHRETDIYVEPFVGAGALFWELLPKRACLGDLNAELFVAWLALEKCYFDETLEWLRDAKRDYQENPEAAYYRWRSLLIQESEVGRQAARTIFLNKAGFNGLYRVNKNGQFNVPWGKNPKAEICDVINLRACAAALREIEVSIKLCDFEDWMNIPVGSLVYFDPPYVPLSKTSNFTSYTKGGFPYKDQLRLAAFAANLRDKGVHVMLSQAADESLIDQYRRLGFACDLVSARRNVNSAGSKRGPVGEYIIYGSGK